MLPGGADPRPVRQATVDSRLIATVTARRGFLGLRAVHAGPPLVSASLHVTGAQISGLLSEHGAPGVLNGLTRSRILARQDRPFPEPFLRGLDHPLREADVIATGERVQFWRDLSELSELSDLSEPDDPFWDVADHECADLRTMPPVSMVTGWWNLFLQLQLESCHRRSVTCGT